jgi:ABC-type antimicrobial peptide transport system permease subunit
MGTRLALGAQPSQVIRLVVREGLAFPVVGLGVGVAASLALTRFIRASLYGVTATDPRIFALTALVLLAVSALACVLPARRVTRIDPLEALRHD